MAAGMIWKGAIVAASGAAALLVAGISRSQTDAGAPPAHSWPAQPPQPPVIQTPADNAPSVERGRYLAVVGDCEGCHTAPGSAPLAGGLALNTPFGTIYSTNITPDKDTGIGGWTKEQFRRALKQGKDDEGHNLYPAMPYTYYAHATDADVDAIYDYLQTVKPAHAEDRANGLPFPLNIRFFVTFWNWLNFKKDPALPHPANPSPEWSRGAYIVNGLGHCGACHTPKNLLGGDKWEKALQGGELDFWYAPNLVGGRRAGLSGWSNDEIVQYLKTGSNSHAEVTGSMQDVIEHETSKMSDADLRAVAVYLKSLPEAPPPAPKAPGQQAMRSGKAIYLDQCAACHAPDGTGATPIFPPLKDNPGVQQASATNPIRAILTGAQEAATPAKPTQPAMPAYAWKLTDYEIAAVASYVRNSFGNAADPVDPHDVAKLRSKVAKHPIQLAKGEN